MLSCIVKHVDGFGMFQDAHFSFLSEEPKNYQSRRTRL